MIESLDYMIRTIESYKGKKDILEKNLASLVEKQISLDKNILESKECKEYYGKAVEILYEQSLGALKDTLNTALGYIIYDKNYEVNLVLEDKRGSKSLNISLLDLEDDLEVDLKDGVGQGIRTIISFVLKMYYLINKSTNILLLDEKYSNISEEYVSRFFEFVNNMAQEKDFIIALISHDKRFFDYCEYVYSVADGCVKKIK